MAALSAIAPRLAKLIPRLATDHDGEALATVAAIRRTLESAGLDLHTLAEALGEPAPEREPKAAPEPPTTWSELAAWCRDIGASRLGARELEFVTNMSARLILGGAPTERQAAWLRAIYERLKRVTS